MKRDMFGAPSPNLEVLEQTIATQIEMQSSRRHRNADEDDQDANNSQSMILSDEEVSGSTSDGDSEAPALFSDRLPGIADFSPEAAFESTYLRIFSLEKPILNQKFLFKIPMAPSGT